ncbi:hypothetical protein FQN49_003195 [Arthroderma sp. PD_2]|nr:hypothetical protein FQN49_003195 [Arthroderma sp. PD_2]
MQLSILANAVLVVGCMAQSNSACMPTSSDINAVKFAYNVQRLLSSYYNSVPVNQTFFSALPNNTVPPTDFMANAIGLKRQAQLGVDALQQLSSKASNETDLPMCDYNLPTPMDAKSHLMTAYQIEATLCGAFIGLAAYVQSPEASFLMARLSAEHGIHASYIGSHMKSQVFMANSTSLTAAFTPEQVVESGDSVGHLGQYMNSCSVPTPSAICGGKLEIGDLGANITGTDAPMSTGGSMSTNAGSILTGMNGLLGGLAALALAII